MKYPLHSVSLKELKVLKGWLKVENHQYIFPAMKKLILILSTVFASACLAQNPQILPADLVGKWDAANKQCESENSGIGGVFNSMFDKKPIPCIERDLATGELTRRGWCPEEVAIQPDTKVTVWKNCRPANLLFVPLESAKDAKTEDIIRDYWFSLDNSVFEEKNSNLKEAAFYSARMNEDADELEKRGYCYHGEAADRKDRLVPCTKKELARRNPASVKKKAVKASAKK